MFPYLSRFTATLSMGIFSLLSASLFTVMDAVDVAFTEAAVGAGISTLLMLATLSLTTSQEHPEHNRPRPLALVVVILTGVALIYGTFDMTDANRSLSLMMARAITARKVNSTMWTTLIKLVLPTQLPSLERHQAAQVGGLSQGVARERAGGHQEEKQEYQLGGHQ